MKFNLIQNHARLHYRTDTLYGDSPRPTELHRQEAPVSRHTCTVAHATCLGFAHVEIAEGKDGNADALDCDHAVGVAVLAILDANLPRAACKVFGKGKQCDLYEVGDFA